MKYEVEQKFPVDNLQAVEKRLAEMGGKISGAGGGGYMFFYCRFDRKHVVAQQLERLGARVVDFDFDRHGLQTWEVR